jgi:hypothetical protein
VPTSLNIRRVKHPNSQLVGSPWLVTIEEMKELFAAFNTDFFRALTTLIIPGALAVSTWSVQLVLTFDPLKKLVEDNHVESAFVLFVAVVFVGLVIEDVGSRIESLLDNRADKNTQGQHSKEWYAYLKTAFVCEPIGRRYIRTLVTRLKFELGTAIGILVADIGLGWLWVGGFASLRLSLTLLLLSLIVAVYLGLFEASASHRLLGKARSAMLDEIRVVKSDSEG